MAPVAPERAVLILPLHRPLTPATFPFVTTLLVLANVLVFFMLQSGDGEAARRAHLHYVDSGLATLEAPLYQRHLGVDSPIGATAQEPTGMFAMQRDGRFRERLEAGELFDDPDAFAAWQARATEFERLRQRVFTDRLSFRSDAPRTIPLLGSMFLHGGIEHLLGNMLFLIALGLLVEGPLGGALFAALYLLSGMAAGLAWLAWHGSAPGAVIGASGAIAGLMGAFCVLWGRRQVRFFYWFFVVFDYVRAPALVLLPLWLGWELLQMVLLDGSRVAYSAHAGGIVAGALLAFGVRGLGWQREAWFDEVDDAPDPDLLYRQALAALGRMQPDQAAALLDTAQRLAPARFDIRLAQYRCARYAGQAALARQRAVELLELHAPNATSVRELTIICAEVGGVSGGLPAGRLADLALKLAAIGDGEVALSLLDSLTPLRALQSELPQRWLALAFRLRDAGDTTGMQAALRRLIEDHGGSDEAGKARFLLSVDATG
jgi:membrane associated rhomboid family serine protease